MEVLMQRLPYLQLLKAHSFYFFSTHCIVLVLCFPGPVTKYQNALKQDYSLLFYTYASSCMYPPALD
jgi:hypothetical protein